MPREGDYGFRVSAVGQKEALRLSQEPALTHNLKTSSFQQEEAHLFFAF
jgi:hypothetical protein